ncbi:MAG: hypothetical protein R3Y32_06500 [Bacillota bacterium]
MNNFQNLYSLYLETQVFTALSIAIFFVFLAGVSASLFYLASSRSAFLFDSMQICTYLDKSVMPEPIRLKILFLSFPTQQKEILTAYLKSPEQRPKKLFSKTLEQLKCEILERVNYNKNIAMLFFIITAVVILSSSLQSLETKVLGVAVMGLIVYSIDLFCDGVFIAIKYGAYQSFKKAVDKMDNFHNIYSNKFKCGLFPSQGADSPFLKTAMNSMPTTKTAPQSGTPNKNAPPTFSQNLDVTILEKRKQQLDSPNLATEISPCPQFPNAIVDKPKSQQPPRLQSNGGNFHGDNSVSSILKQMQNATDNLDLDTFDALSTNLSTLLKNEKITPTDQFELQQQLDKCLRQFGQT